MNFIVDRMDTGCIELKEQWCVEILQSASNQHIGEYLVSTS